MKEKWLMALGAWEEIKPGINAALESGFDCVLVDRENIERVRELGTIKVACFGEVRGTEDILVVGRGGEGDGSVALPEDPKSSLDSALARSITGTKAAYVFISGKKYEEFAVDMGKVVEYLLVIGTDWKIIPLESMIARLQGSSVKIISGIETAEEAAMALTTLEKGSAGVLLESSDPSEIRRVKAAVEQSEKGLLKLLAAKITSVWHALKIYYRDTKIWSGLPFRIVEIIVGLVLVASGIYLFTINLSAIRQHANFLLDAIVIPIKLILLIVPAFIGFVIINAGTFSKNPANVARRNLRILLLFVLVFAMAISAASSILEIAPNEFIIDQKISLGDLLAPLSILISIATISYGWFKDQQQRRKEYADSIRSAAGTILAMMARRNSLNERFFENIQPSLLNSVLLLIEMRDTERAYDFLRKEIIKEGMNISQMRLEVQLEEAFKELYGYDPKLRKAFADTMYSLKIIEDRIYMAALLLFQVEIYSVRINRYPYKYNLEIAQENEKSKYAPISKKDLVNDLQNIAAMLSYEQKDLFESIVSIFSEPLMNIINSDDNQIFDKCINLSMPPLAKFWKSALEGLELCAQKKFTESIPLFSQAINQSKNKNISVAGFFAARGLAHLGRLNRAQWKLDTEKAKNIELNESLIKLYA